MTSAKDKEKIRIQNKEYRERNKETIRAYHQKRYLKNKDKILAKGKIWVEKNKDKIAERVKQWQKKNAKTIAAKSNIWRKNNLDKVKAIAKRYREAHKEKIAAYNKKRWLNPESKEYHKIWNEKNRDKVRAYGKAPSAKAKKKAYTSRPDRKAKKAEYTVQYQQKPIVREKRNAQSRTYRKTPQGLDAAKVYNERRRSRHMGAEGSHTREEWNKIRDATKGICSICKRDVGTMKMTIDHIKPLSKGGSNYISNIRAICRSCNSKLGPREYIWIKDPITGKVIKQESFDQ